MGRAVGADQAGAINGKQYRQLLVDDVVHNLIVGALQKSRIDGDNGFQPVTAMPRQRRRYAAHVEVTIRIFLLEPDQSRSPPALPA